MGSQPLEDVRFHLGQCHPFAGSPDDLAPATVLGKVLASMAMLTGYSIIAVPTGIISIEIGKAVKSGRGQKKLSCASCGHEEHDEDAAFCKICGGVLSP